MVQDGAATSMRLVEKILFTCIGGIMAVVGVAAISFETHTGYARGIGIRTLIGSDAVWFGQTCLVLAVLPMLVWVKRTWVGWSVVVWWLVLMGWIFVPIFCR
jgi:hypothetical protein